MLPGVNTAQIISWEGRRFQQSFCLLSVRLNNKEHIINKANVLYIYYSLISRVLMMPFFLMLNIQDVQYVYNSIEAPTTT